MRDMLSHRGQLLSHEGRAGVRKGPRAPGTQYYASASVSHQDPKSGPGKSGPDLPNSQPENTKRDSLHNLMCSAHIFRIRSRPHIPLKFSACPDTYNKIASAQLGLLISETAGDFGRDLGYGKVLIPVQQHVEPHRHHIDAKHRSFITTCGQSPRVTPAGKEQLVNSLLNAKQQSGKTFTQISEEVGLTNAYTAQLFYNQAQLKAGTVDALKKAVPALTADQIEIMQACPTRSYDDAILQEPHVYRMHEAVVHYGEAIKAILNEECGDGIMSAIDMFFTVKVIKGKSGEKRVCLTLNGKFLAHTEQLTADNTA